MRLEYTLSLDDAKAAELLYIRQKLGRRIGYRFLRFGIPSLAMISWIGFYAFHVGAKNDLALGYSMVVVILTFLAIRIPRDRSKRLHSLVKPKTAKGEASPARSIEIDEEKISVEIPAITKTDFAWSAIANVSQDEKVTLIFVNDKAFILVPARAFGSTQRAELDDFISRHLPKKLPC